MKSFREQLGEDMQSTFFNLDEFAEMHNIDGRDVPVVVDNDTLLELEMRQQVDTDGIFLDDRMFFVQKKYLEREPVVGQIMRFDGEMFPVWKVLEDAGGYTIILRGNES